MATRDSEGKTVDQAEDALLDAMRDSNVPALRRLLNESLTFSLPDGSVIGRDADLKAHSTGATKFESLTEERRSTHEHDGRARTISLTKVELLDRGNRIQTTLSYERYWSIIDGRWQIVAGSASSVP